MIVQDFIRANGLLALNERFKVKINRSILFPNLVMLKYSQIDSPMAEPVVQKCRGLILDEKDDWKIISYPYDKFFNHGEGHAAKIDWSSASVLEKEDGSLMTLYWYEGKWRVASSGLPDAHGKPYASAPTFAEIFWDVWTTLRYQLPPPSRRSFMFEMCTKHNRVIVNHAKPRLVCHGVRNLETLDEGDPVPWAGDYGWEIVKHHPLGSLEEILATSEKLPGAEREGFVVRDAASR